MIDVQAYARWLSA